MMIDNLNTMLSTLIYFLTTPSWLLYLATIIVVVISVNTVRSKLKRKVLLIAVWGTIAIAPLGQWLIQPLEQRFKTPLELNQIRGVIVLGGGQRLGPIQGYPYSGYGQHSARMLAGLALANQHQVPLYFLGGQQTIGKQLYRESLAIKNLHNEFAMTTPLIIDNDSRNTFDNALKAKTLIADADIKHYLLITSAAHMPRAVGAFRQVGLEPIPYPVNFMSDNNPSWFDISSLTMRLYLIDYAAHEWLGLIQYYTLGRSSELFPQSVDK